MSTGEYMYGNTSIGHNALHDALEYPLDVKVFNNTAFGAQALRNLIPSANENTAIGAEALSSAEHGENTAVGAYAAARVNGTANTSVGCWALRYNLAGSENTSIGHRSLAGTDGESAYMATGVGSRNTGAGAHALRQLHDGSDNVAFGYNAGRNIVDEEKNTLIGADSNIPLGSGISYSTALGADAVVTQSNSIVLGRAPTVLGAVDYVGIGTTQPLAALHVNGGLINRVTYRALSAPSILSYVVLPTDYVVVINITDLVGTFVVTLPLISSINGRTYVIKNMTASAVPVLNVVTISPDTFDDSLLSVSLSLASGTTMRVITNGTLYHII